jgi:hypothetical protein
MSVICLAGGGVVVKLAAAITLSWTHSVEKVKWEEDWRAHPAGIAITESRVKGSGAGMDPPPGSKLKNGVYSYRPHLAPVKEIALRRSGATADWNICMSGACKPMSDYLPANADPVTLSRCD